MSPLLLAALLSTDAHADVRRIAMLVANNEGATGSHPLYFAEDDAVKMESVLTGVAGYETGDVHVLLGRDRRAFLQLYGDIKADIQDAAAEGDQVVFLFYYSGHADDDGLQLRDTRVAYGELEALLDISGAEIRMAFIDACNSGNLTKGATMAPGFVFDVSERLGAEGTVIITSSSSDEASQESDEIAGSYFTHYLVSGMSGFADANGDDKVTLGEAYEYVFYETVVRTSQSSLGTQHPTYEWDLSGEGDVVLVDLTPASATLLFPGTLSGTFAVFDLDRRTFLGEVSIFGEDRQMALSPGNYLIQVRYPTYLKVAEVRVREGQTVDLGTIAFRTVSYDEDKAKGIVDARVRKARRPENTVLVDVGGLAAGNPQIAQEFLPNSGSLGVTWRLTRERRANTFWGIDVSGGSAPGTLQIPDTQPIAVRTGFGMAGLSLGQSSRQRPGPVGWFEYQAGIGIRMGGLYLDRSFPNGDAPYQWAVAPAPGWSWFAQMSRVKGDRMVWELHGHHMYVPYALSEDQAVFRMRQVTLSAGFRF